MCQVGVEGGTEAIQLMIVKFLSRVVHAYMNTLWYLLLLANVASGGGSQGVVLQLGCRDGLILVVQGAG